MKAEIYFKKFGFYPNKLMGQSFLISQKFRKKIIETAELLPEDTVIEVGAGDGSLTFEIAQKAKLVLAIEKDKRLAEALQKLVSEKNLKNIIVINEDILKLDLATCHCEERPSRGVVAREPNDRSNLRVNITPRDCFADARHDDKIARHDELRKYKLMGNIPYYLTSRLLRRFLAEEKLKPKEIILTVQKEVAERITAKPPHMNLLALSAQAYGQPKVIAYIPASAFWPQPKVDSAIIKISEISNVFFVNPVRTRTAQTVGGNTSHTSDIPGFNDNKRGRRSNGVKNEIDSKKFFALIKTAFSQKRKKLANSLAKFLGNKKTAETAIRKAGLNNNARPEELSLEDWVKLIMRLQKNPFRHCERPAGARQSHCRLRLLRR